MFSTICVCIIALLGMVNAQVFSSGECNPNITAMKKFNKEQYLGLWYVIHKTDNTIEDCCKCLRTNFTKDTKNLYIVNATSNSKEDNTQKKMTYIIKAKDLKHGRLNFRPGYLLDQQLFSILDTDYFNYAVVYSCVPSLNGKLETVWIAAKTTNPDKIYLDKAISVLVANGINLKLISEDQEC